MSVGQRLRLGSAFPVLSHLPSGLAYAAATRVGLWSGQDLVNARTAVRNGYLSVWPEMANDSSLLDSWGRRYTDMLARETMDVFRMHRLDAGTIRSLIDVDDVSALAQAQQEGRGVILVMAHFSRLIMLLAALGMMGFRIGMLTMRVDSSNEALAPAMRRFLQMKIDRLRQVIRGNWICLGDNLRPMYTGLARGEVWVVLADAYMADFGEWREFPFLGGTLRLSGGIERIAARTGARMVYGAVNERGSRLVGDVRALPADPSAGLAAAVGELERDVRATPWQWWQWNILDYIWSSGAKV